MMSQQQFEEAAPSDYSEYATSIQINDAIERHQMALKMDMMEIMQNHEKEINFWKNKALRMRKRMGYETAMGQDPPTAIAPGIDDDEKDIEKKLLMEKMELKLLMEKISALERVAQRREVLIDSLRQTIKTQEKASEERVKLLENQLEKLVEMTAKVASTTTNNSINSTQPPSEFDNINAFDNDKNNDAKDPTYEVSVLEQLLVRVLAEKDKLLFENQNMRAVLKETDSLPSFCSNGFSSGEIHEEYLEKQSQDVGNSQNETDDFGVWDALKSADDQNEYCKVIYKMSCRKCQQNHSHIKYVGSCTGNFADSQEALKRIMGAHFSQIWNIVQEQDDAESVSSSVRSDELRLLADGKGSNISHFPSSSLARHITKHCGSFSSERDVIKWCRDNVKLEVNQGLNLKATSLKKRRDKSRRKERKRDRRSHGDLEKKRDRRSNTESSF